MCCSIGNIQKRVTSSVAQAAPWYQQAEHHVASQLHTSLQFPGDNTVARKSCLYLPPFPPLFPEVTRDVCCVLRSLSSDRSGAVSHRACVVGAGVVPGPALQPAFRRRCLGAGMCLSVLSGRARSFFCFLFIDSQLIFQTECTFTLIFFLWVPCLSVSGPSETQSFLCGFSPSQHLPHTSDAGRSMGVTGSGTCCGCSWGKSHPECCRGMHRSCGRKWWPLLLGFTAPTGSQTGPREIT